MMSRPIPNSAAGLNWPNAHYCSTNKHSGEIANRLVGHREGPDWVIPSKAHGQNLVVAPGIARRSGYNIAALKYDLRAFLKDLL